MAALLQVMLTSGTTRYADVDLLSPSLPLSHCFVWVIGIIYLLLTLGSLCTCGDALSLQVICSLGLYKCGGILLRLLKACSYSEDSKLPPESSSMADGSDAGRIQLLSPHCMLLKVPAPPPLSRPLSLAFSPPSWDALYMLPKWKSNMLCKSFPDGSAAWGPAVGLIRCY